MEQEIQEALELAAGQRIGGGKAVFERQNASKNDIAITKRQIMLFLEAVPGELSVAEVIYVLDNMDD